jgi:hypothetical protein
MSREKADKMNRPQTYKNETLRVNVPDKASVLRIFEDFINSGDWARMGYQKHEDLFLVWATNDTEII